MQVLATASNMNCDPVLAQRLNHFRDIQGPWWNLVMHSREHRNRITSFSGDFQHLTAPRAEAKSMNGTGRNMHECTFSAQNGFTRTREYHLALFATAETGYHPGETR
jgi:hypothetical protein